MIEEAGNAKKYISWGIIIGIIILSYLILKDLIISILTALILAFAVKPFNDWLARKTGKKFAAVITLTLIILSALVLIILFVTAFAKQLISFLSPSNIANLTSLVSDYFESELVRSNLDFILGKVGETFVAMIIPTLSYIPIFLLNLFIIFFTTYYLLVEWDRLEAKVVEIIPFKEKTKIISVIKKRMSEIISGTLLIVLIEFIFSAVFLYFLGVKSYLVLAFAIAILAFIPGIGPGAVWIPLAVIEYIYGKPLIALGVLVMGIVLSVGIDYLLRVKILQKRTGTHPIIMLFGIIGGVKLFGIVGLILGPVILGVAITIIENIPRSKS